MSRYHNTTPKPGVSSDSHIAKLLAARASDGSRQSSEKATEEALRPGEFLDSEGIGGRPIFIIRDAAGTPVGVRKVATNLDPLPGHFAATQWEANMYITLTKLAGWRNHILPVRSVKADDSTVVIDFDWLDGEDVKIHLKNNPSDMFPILREILLQLQWLALQGYVHGDIKLDNFYRAADGRTLLFDFGRAMKLTYLTMQTELNAFGHIIRSHDEKLAKWIQMNVIDTYDHSKSAKENLSEMYVKIIIKLAAGRHTNTNAPRGGGVTGGAGGTRRRSSNTKKRSSERKTSRAPSGPS